MPIPFLLAGAGAVVVGGFGAVGHMCAADTNKEAEKISHDAELFYLSAKHALEREKKKTEDALQRLGYSKKNVLETSMKSFLRSYEKLKDVKVNESNGLNEISNFTITPQDAIQLRKMENIYTDSAASGVAGAATGALIALAANGSLGFVATLASTAGTVLEFGGLSAVGAAAGCVGSALSFGASMTPLSAVVAPVVLFTGISASMKADENLEKAKAMRAEANAAIEKMNVSRTLCEGITRRSEMFSDLLTELNGMFEECVHLQNEVVSKKEGLYFGERLKASYFSENEIALIAVTRSLAGAVKAIIDTPILTEKGMLSDASQKQYDKIKKEIPLHERKVETVQRINGSVSNAIPNKIFTEWKNVKKYYGQNSSSKEYRKKLIEMADKFIESIDPQKNYQAEYNDLIKAILKCIEDLEKDRIGDQTELGNLKQRYFSLCKNRSCL